MIDEAAYAAFRVTDMRPARVGRAWIERVHVTAENAAELPGRVREGPLTKLWIGAHVATTDALGEFVEQYPAIEAARGDVMVHGLGLGAVVRAMLAKPEVRHVDIIEISADVLRLIAPYFVGNPRVTIWLGDAYDGSAIDGDWDLVYSDIWVDGDDHTAEHEAMREEWRSRCVQHILWEPDALSFVRTGRPDEGASDGRSDPDSAR